MTIIIIIDREYSRSILYSEPYDYYYYRPRGTSRSILFSEPYDYYYYRPRVDREYSRSILFSEPYDYYYYYYYSCEVDYKSIQKKLKQLSSSNFHTRWVI